MAALTTELYRISPEELDNLLDPELEPDSESSIWLRGLGDLELVGLWEVLPGAKSDGTLMAELLSDEEAEVLLLRVPDNFLQCIRDLSPEQIPDVAAKWRQIEEVSDWSADDLIQPIQEIQKLAIDAASRGQLVVQRSESFL